MKSLFRILLLLAVLVLLGMAFYAGSRFSGSWQKQSEEKADVLLTQVRAACKLITAEGYFSEIYDYKDHYYFDISPLRKKALMRVRAKVSLGYDLEEMKINAIPDQQKVVISNIPDIGVLSIDHTVDYYDITEGTFNNFSPEDYNTMNQRAKSFIRQHALDSRLLEEAEKQGNEVFDLIRTIVESAGWELVLVERKPPGSPFAG